MQLSAPLPSFDPCATLSPDSATPSLLTGDGENTNGLADFGALLSAQTSTVRAEREPSSVSVGPVLPALDPTTAGLVPSIVRSPRPGAVLGLAGDTTVEQNAVSSVLATMAAVSPAVETPKIGEVDFTSTQNGTEMAAGTDCSGRLSPGGALVDGSSANVRGHHGRRLVDGMTSGKIHVGIRAYGLSLDAAASPRPFVKGRSIETTETVAGVSAEGQILFAPPLPAGSEPSTMPVSAPGARPSDRVAVSAGGITSSARPLSSGVVIAAAATGASSSQPMVTRPQSSDTLGAASGAVLLAEPAELAKTNAALSELSSLPKAGVETQLVVEPSESASNADPLPGENPSSAPRSAVKDIHVEKFAAQLFRSSDGVDATQKQTQKLSEIAALKRVAGSQDGVGINAAQPQSPMASTVSTSPASPISPQGTPFEAAPASFDNLVSEMTDGKPGQSEPAARRAVESALAVAEKFIPGDQRSVQLKFSVGGEDLAVRVEMRGDKVHTTFRTDSPELCTALAREWQSVSGQTSARSQRLADPVFASSGSNSNPSLSPDSGSAHQRDSAPQQNRATDEFVAFRRAERQPETTPTISGPTPISLPLSNSGRLHTFA